MVTIINISTCAGNAQTMCKGFLPFNQHKNKQVGNGFASEYSSIISKFFIASRTSDMIKLSSLISSLACSVNLIWVLIRLFISASSMVNQWVGISFIRIKSDRLDLTCATGKQTWNRGVN